MFLFFFFSSRRRHTRLQGDWSSDVCSSDLVAGNRAHVSRPIARPGVGYGRYAGGRYGYGRGVGWGVGAAGVGAVAAGAYYGNSYYGNSCYRDAYGQLICPNQYQYQYAYSSASVEMQRNSPRGRED